MGRFAALLALILIAPSGGNIAVASNVSESDYALSQVGVASLGFDSMTTFRTMETQTSLARREATAQEKQAAIANGRAIYASFTPEKRAKLKKEKVRYLAVATTPTASASTSLPDNSAAGGAGLDLMIFDTSAGTVANRHVYTLQKKPDAGSSIKLGDYNTLFTGL